MSPLVEVNLALILFLPWFGILATLFWAYPRGPRTPARRRFDVGALVLCTLAFLLSVDIAQAIADPVFGRIWRQVLATAVGYGVFLAALVLAFVTRNRLFPLAADG